MDSAPEFKRSAADASANAAESDWAEVPGSEPRADECLALASWTVVSCDSLVLSLYGRVFVCQLSCRCGWLFDVCRRS